MSPADKFIRGSTAVLAALLVCQGCRIFFPTRVPIRTIHSNPGNPPVNGKDLVLMLPGGFSDAKDFIQEGFFRMAKKSGLELDMVAVDAHYGYYIRRTLLERLHADVIKPARKKGYRRIWILGISMGGLGAALYLRKYPDTIHGVILLAPYLGDKPVLREIEKAGGLARWTPKREVRKKDYQRLLWLFLKKYAQKPRPDLPRILLGWGSKDRLRRANRLLAAVLPKDQVFHTRGKHDWGPWRRLWGQVLRSRPFRSKSMPPTPRPGGATPLPPPSPPTSPPARKTGRHPARL